LQAVLVATKENLAHRFACFAHTRNADIRATKCNKVQETIFFFSEDFAVSFNDAQLPVFTNWTTKDLTYYKSLLGQLATEYVNVFYV
jgi:hypothetical protein